MSHLYIIIENEIEINHKYFNIMKKMMFWALSLLLFGNVFANENVMAKTLVTNNVAYTASTTPEQDTTVTIERMLLYEELSAYVNSMDEKGWYLKCMLVDEGNELIKITFTDVAPTEKKYSDECKFYGIVVVRHMFESHEILEFYKDGQRLPEGYIDGEKWTESKY